MSEVSEEDWAVLRAVQARLEAHPITAPILGAPHAHAHGAWPPYLGGFGRSGLGGPPPPLWPAPVAPASPPPPPTVIDGALMHELLELPEWAQRMVLGGAQAEEWGGSQSNVGMNVGDNKGSSPHVVAFFDNCDVRSDIAPLPVEAVLGVVQRVMET